MMLLVQNEMFTFDFGSENAILDSALERWMFHPSAFQINTLVATDSGKRPKIENRPF